MTTSDSVTISTPTDREVVVTRTFDAPRALVFDAYTQPELLKRWYGAPGRSLIVAYVLESAALLMMPFAGNLAGVMLGGALYFMGSAIGGARILALAMEQAPAERRGRAMASFSVAFPLSNGTGAMLSGLVVDLAGYNWMYITAALPCAVGLLLTAKYWKSLR